MSNLTEAIIAGVVSGLILQIIAAWITGGRPSGPAKVIQIGDHNENPEVDAREYSQHEVNLVQHVHHSQRPASSARSTDEGDDGATMFLAVVGAFAACLAFLYSWPVAIGVTVGAAVSTSLTAIQMWRSTHGTAGPRGQITLAGAWGAALAAVGSWWVVFGGPAGRVGMADVEASVVKEFPAFDDGLGPRWTVIADDPAAVVQAMPWQDVLYLLAGVVFVALAVFVVASDVLRWWSFRNVAAERTTKPGPVNRAYAYAFGSTSGRWAALMLASVVALGCTSGYVGELFDWMQSRQLDQVEAR